ncbi:MAG: IS1595 family transposase, partial [Candidatus Poribacteria bacterium]|nr:IS1595 family transposase [Candidatus Poribacteria bacterium]
MCLVHTMNRFPTEASCFTFLEDIRYKNGAYCPFCASLKVGRKREKQRIGRWNCRDCYSSFRVTHGTLFQDSKVPMRTWFVAITLMMNAKKSISSHQLGRDLGINHMTAWYIQTRIRDAMENEDRSILNGMVEADETYVGGKPRKGNKRKDDHKPRGPGR